MSAPVAGAITAVVGMFFDIPPQYGYMIGSTLWGVSHPTQVEGPKLQDLKVITSQYGGSIPNTYGAVRISGNVIWSIPLVQIGSTESQKGGSEVTTYKQYAVFAMGLCEGVIEGIGRIWVNNKLYSTNNKNASIHEILTSSRLATITVYKGDEEQMPDPVIQSYAGVENVCANRGLAYIVFDMMEYPSRGLNIEVEVFKDGQVFYVAQEVYNFGDSFMSMTRIAGTYFPSISQKNQIAYLYGFYNEQQAASGIATYWNAIVNTDGTVKPLHQILLPSSLHDASFSNLSKSTDGSILYIGRNNTTYSRNYSVVYQEGNIVNLSLYMPAEDFGISDAIAVKDNEQMFIAAHESTTQQKICKIEFSGMYPTDGFNVDVGYKIRAMAIGNNYLFVLDNLSNIRKYDLDLNFIGFIFQNNNVSFYLSDITTENDTVYGGGGFNIYKIENNDKTFIASTLSTGVGINVIYYQNSNFYYRSSGDTFGKIFMVAKTTDGYDVPVSSIVTDLCLKSDLTEEEIDVSLIEDEFLRGYVINGVMTTGSAIEQLANYFFFDGCESDDKLKFIKRGRKAPIIIPEDDLAAHLAGSQMPDDLSGTRKQSLELPEKVTLKYMSIDSDYQVCSQFARRYAVNSQNSSVTEVAIVQNDTQARQMADKILTSQWIERASYSLTLGPKYLFLEPTDVIQTTKDGEIYTMRITEINFQNNILTVNAVAEDLESYDSFVTGVSSYRNNSTVYSPSSTDIYFLDIPLLRDQDDGVGYYLTANGFQPNNWNGTQVYKSFDDGASFVQYIKYIERKGIFGQCKNILGNSQSNDIDFSNSITVKVNGLLSSTNLLNVYNGANLALIGKEIIQYKNAESLGNNLYKLSHLIRGKFGTENEISKHKNGDMFISLALSTLYLEPSNNGEYGLERQYKALSSGETLTDAITVKFTNNAVAQMPYSPCQLGGGRNATGDLRLKWTRRTRINGGWNNNTDVPLGETSELYSIDIFKNNEIIRTIQSTEQKCLYTKEEQIADFGSIQSSVKFTVYQISSTVGAGFGETATI